ncbi:VCBS repeat-containing protein [Aestuariimicrobium sp. T2.26MG-19.2B]|uniref:VCBS repeat-containing protein n=1 Tax=Aestuariimicrobium sp. T2.26MG-19.2B TaxID=3040679 RepID=UPI0024774994|nr:VCBS repeat-containing protein [Aestuariimicrobium sp. T2.26MG-19.2B]CAI9404836.1 hypothetical protein AESSP_01292 [Aestuariimicrobium sp. T2.26MG-19.2B]
MPTAVQPAPVQPASSPTGTSSWARHRTRLAPLLALAAAAAGSIAVATPAHAVGVEGPFTSFGYARTFQGIKVQATMPQPAGESGVWETSVKVCNHSVGSIPVGPENFSFSRDANTSYYFAKRDTPVHAPLPSVQLAPTACVSGALATAAFQPYQLAFHQHKLGLNVDIVPATEFEGTYEPTRFPQAIGATFHPNDYVGDHAADVYALTATGGINLYRTTSTGLTLQRSVYTPIPGVVVNGRIAKAADLDSDGMTDLIVGTVDGRLLVLRAMEGGRLGVPYEIGRGWASTSLVTILPGNGSTRQTFLFARTKSGDLMRYRLTERGLEWPRKVGTGWGAMTQMLSVGDVTGDGDPDLIAVRADGTLYRYQVDSNGQITSAARIGGGWQSMRLATSPGDINLNGKGDILAVRSDGTLYAYLGWGNGTFTVGKKIGQNWQSVSSLA